MPVKGELLLYVLSGMAICYLSSAFAKMIAVIADLVCLLPCPQYDLLSVVFDRRLFLDTALGSTKNERCRTGGSGACRLCDRK